MPKNIFSFQPLLTGYPTLSKSLFTVLGIAALSGCVTSNTTQYSQINSDQYKTGDFLQEDHPTVQPLAPAIKTAGNYLIALHAKAKHDYATAANILHKLWLNDRNNALFGYEVIEMAMLSGRFEMALEVANALRDNGVHSNTPNQQNLLGVLLAIEHLKAGRYNAALREAQNSIINIGGAQYMRPIILAWAHVGLGGYDKARAALEAETRLQAIRNVYDLNLAYLAINQEDYSLAAQTLKGLIDRLDIPPIMIQELYIKLLFWGEGEVAAHSYLRTLDNFPKRDQLALSLRESNPPNPSEHQLQQTDHALAEGMNEISKLLRAEIPKLGLFFAQSSLYLNPNNQVALLLVGDIQFDLERYDEALLSLSKISNPNSATYRDAVTLAAETEQKTKRPEAAVKRMKRAIAQFPKDPDLKFELGQIYQYEQDYPMAITLYDEVIASRPVLQPNWRDFYFRGISHERNDQWDLAEQDFLRALEINPNNSYALNYLGYSWVDQRKNIPRALKMLEKAVALAPENAYVIDSYGWALYRIEEFEAAAEHLELAMVMEPSEAVIIDHLGDVYWHLGRKTEAKYQWERALSLELDTVEERIIIEEKLAGKRIPHP